MMKKIMIFLFFLICTSWFTCGEDLEQLIKSNDFSFDFLQPAKPHKTANISKTQIIFSNILETSTFGAINQDVSFFTNGVVSNKHKKGVINTIAAATISELQFSTFNCI